ncbi:MAG: hypothetical protein ABSC94_29595 [Polyangiaceae bacterium]|jgi:hypothetical protein
MSTSPAVPSPPTYFGPLGDRDLHNPQNVVNAAPGFRFVRERSSYRPVAEA